MAIFSMFLLAMIFILEPSRSPHSPLRTMMSNQDRDLTISLSFSAIISWFIVILESNSVVHPQLENPSYNVSL